MCGYVENYKKKEIVIELVKNYIYFQNTFRLNK